jgi:hypothetical protein
MSTGSTSRESRKQLPLFPQDQTNQPNPLLENQSTPLPATQANSPNQNHTKPKPKPEANRLLAAAQFISHAQPKRSNNPAETYCRIWARQLSACAGVLSAGVGIQEEIECCPHTQKLVDALQECPDAVNLTLLSGRELSIKSGNFQATIPCVDQSELPAIYPDPRQFDVSFEFQQALENAGRIVNERNHILLYSSVMLLQGSIAATNGDVIIEAWHGQITPEKLIVPKIFITALRRTKGKTLYSLGCTPDSLTAHYQDSSWFKTRLHHDAEFPNLQGFLDLPVNMEPVPLGFWSAVDRLAPFSNDDRIYLRKEGMCTDKYQTDGAINTCKGLPDGISFSISTLRLIQPFAEKIAFNVTRNMTYFQGRNIRGVIAQRAI